MMRKKFFCAAVFSAFAILTVSAQVEVPTEEQSRKWLSDFQGMSEQASPEIAPHFKKLRNAPDKAKINAVRAGKAYSGTNLKNGILYFNTDPMSETQYLPDVFPFDAEPGQTVQILAARDEFEPGSFIVYPFRDFGKVEPELTDFKNADGKIFPKDALDLAVIKVWYQNKNAWYSYFQDPGLKLCPELVLHDENLIKVDTERTANYARLTEPDGKVSYRWLTQPRELENRVEVLKGTGYYGYSIRDTFFSMKQNFMDAASIQPVSLNEGEFKQFLLTAHVGKDQEPGLYTGKVLLKQGQNIVQEIPVEIRVLPFTLPRPGTYFDTEKPFLPFFCTYVGLDKIMTLNGNDAELAKKQLFYIAKKSAEHNEFIPNFRDAFKLSDMAKQAGMDTSLFVTMGMKKLDSAAEMRYDARIKKLKHIRKFGHNRYFLSWGDEYGLSTLKQIRPMIDIYKAEGFRFTINSRHGYAAAGYLADLFWPPVNPDNESEPAARKFNLLHGDGYFGWYASQHVGVENPAYIRRQYGMGPYRAGLSCHYNYAHHLDEYNDTRGDTYRGMMFYYGSGNGILSTIQWEAFREGMDDIRYATLLQQLANPLAKSPVYAESAAAKKALQFLAETDSDDFDLTTARLEMIRHILNLLKISGK